MLGRVKHLFTRRYIGSSRFSVLPLCTRYRHYRSIYGCSNSKANNELIRDLRQRIMVQLDRSEMINIKNNRSPIGAADLL